MATLKEKLSQKIPGWREEIQKLNKEFGEKVIGEVTVGQAYGGMRGVKALVCDTSEVPPDKGLIIRGIPVGELTEKLPEEVFFLLLTGELPDKAGLAALQDELRSRAGAPQYVWDVLKAMPADSHPMTMLDTAILVMERESVFKRRYNEGMKKDVYWESMLEDSLNLIARLPEIAAGIYRMRFKKGDRIPPKSNLDMGANYSYMLGLPDPKGDFANLMRLYLTLHSDHESGNVSAATTHTVASALSDIYYAVSAGLNGLAGPLHGLANQECLGWILMVMEKFSGVPSDEQLRKFAWDTLNSGKVIPGYGHAVLRITDPRFSAFLAFGKKYCSDSPVFQLVAKVYDIVPKVLTEQGKAKDPWPNVDAGSGALLYHFGLKEFDYYTVLFSVSRALGVCAQAVISRAMGYAIVRPKSVTTEWIKKTVAKA
ncbi:MAG: type I citrate synthase [Candidatus Schekmanbacteria bacterium RBG_16_38_11]|uniref:citrate synthase (unknown stereospecificity) n=1 Tax=Candidatus Schekmanbacteria bacterium RBG_16_38_11 TaxID=1817880 RepID=A0A1F7RSE8_9BACT|nr:MAG: type I citrate synthase [Candidatus Schekmanbacteria bacterium RBG_16_38_11]